MEDTSGGHAAGRYLPENLRALREHREISGSALAQEMRDRGWPWHQTTVVRIEGGKRPVEWGEVVDLALILGVTTDRFMWSGPEAGQMDAVAAASARVRGAFTDLAVAAARLRDAVDEADGVAEQGEQSQYPGVREAAQGVREDIAESTVELALAEADRIRDQT